MNTFSRSRYMRVLHRQSLFSIRTGAMLCLLCLFALSSRVTAQVKEGFDDRTVADPDKPTSRMDSLAQEHMIHVSPHVLVFNEQTKSATVQFSNHSARPIRGELLVLFAYPDWPHGHPADTTVFTERMAMIEPRDTVVLTPGPKDHSAVAWVRGLPGGLLLAPHETKRVTLQLAPPPHLPSGEYWARVVALVRPQDQHRGPGAQDVRQHYALPIKGVIEPLRDSVLVFYRQGAQTTGVSFGGGTAAQYDTIGIGGPDGRDCPHSLWIKLPMHLTGTTHLDGVLTVTYKNVETGELVPVNRFEIPLYRGAVTHWWTHTCWVTPGKYQVILRMTSPQKDLPPGARLPMAPVQYTIPTPFVITR